MPIGPSKRKQKADRAEADNAKERENDRQGRIEPALFLLSKKGFPAFFVYEVLGIFHDCNSVSRVRVLPTLFVKGCPLFTRKASLFGKEKCPNTMIGANSSWWRARTDSNG